MRISNTSRGRFLTCETAWSWRYVDKLIPLRDALSEITHFGKLAHYGLEAVLHQHARGFAEIDVETVVAAKFQTLDEQDLLVGANAETEARAAIEFLGYHVPRMYLGEWETVWFGDAPAIELKLEMEISPGVQFRGHIDWIAKHKPSGKVYVIDHKTTSKSLNPSPNVQAHTQAAMYMELAAANGIPVDGALLHEMRDGRGRTKTDEDGAARTTLPRKPSLLKNGKSLSRAKIPTTAEVYRATMEEHGVEMSPMYEAHLESLASVRFRQWRPLAAYPRERVAILDAVKAAAVSMRDVAERRRLPTLNLVPGYEGHCARCSYREMCVVVSRGFSPSGLLGSHYVAEEGSPLAGLNFASETALLALEADPTDSFEP